MIGIEIGVWFLSITLSIAYYFAWLDYFPLFIASILSILTAIVIGRNLCLQLTNQNFDPKRIYDPEYHLELTRWSIGLWSLLNTACLELGLILHTNL